MKHKAKNEYYANEQWLTQASICPCNTLLRPKDSGITNASNDTC